jgi:hypothetical protein
MKDLERHLTFLHQKRYYLSCARNYRLPINFINPQIIINSSGVEQLFIDLSNGNYSKDNGELYSIANNKIIIDTGHPLRAPTEYYCNQILKIVFENLNKIN